MIIFSLLFELFYHNDQTPFTIKHVQKIAAKSANIHIHAYWSTIFHALISTCTYRVVFCFGSYLYWYAMFVNRSEGTHYYNDRYAYLFRLRLLNYPICICNSNFCLLLLHLQCCLSIILFYTTYPFIMDISQKLIILECLSLILVD